MKYPIGTRVVLKSKFGSLSELRECSVIYNKIIEKNLKCGVIVGYKNTNESFFISEDSYVISYDELQTSGDFFYENDVELYNPYYRKTKLKKIFQNINI